MRIVTAAEMRGVEARCADLGLPGPALMEIAGRAVADVIARERGPLAGRRSLVLVGPGNNGGDGLVVARHLHDFGARPFVYAVLRALDDGDAKVRLLRARGVPLIAAAEDADLRLLRLLLADADLVVDALLGTGRARPAAGLLKEALDTVNARDRGRSSLVAVDLPTGLDADTGAADPSCLLADLTITLGLPKVGLYLSSGVERSGRIVVADIGVPPNLADPAGPRLTTAEVVRALLPDRPLGAHKGTFGKLLVIAGSVDYLGAPALASRAAVRVGAGLVTVAPPAGIKPVVAAHLLEPTWRALPDCDGGIAAEAATVAIDVAAGYDAALVGPGLGQRPETAEFLDGLLAGVKDSALVGWVFDADALNLLAKAPEWWRRLPAHSVLTPHPGEMARLAGQSTLNRLALARAKSAEWGHVVVLKGAYTVVAAPDGRVMVNPFANPALASAGTGDVLAGSIAGLRAQGVGAFDAAVLGCYLHGLAGEWLARDFGRAGGGAADLVERLPEARRSLLGEGRVGDPGGSDVPCDGRRRWL